MAIVASVDHSSHKQHKIANWQYYGRNVIVVLLLLLLRFFVVVVVRSLGSLSANLSHCLFICLPLVRHLVIGASVEGKTNTLTHVHTHCAYIQTYHELIVKWWQRVVLRCVAIIRNSEGGVTCHSVTLLPYHSVTFVQYSSSKQAPSVFETMRMRIAAEINNETTNLKYIHNRFVIRNRFGKLRCTHQCCCRQPLLLLLTSVPLLVIASVLLFSKSNLNTVNHLLMSLPMWGVSFIYARRCACRANERSTNVVFISLLPSSFSFRYINSYFIPIRYVSGVYGYSLLCKPRRLHFVSVCSDRFVQRRLANIRVRATTKQYYSYLLV